MPGVSVPQGFNQNFGGVQTMGPGMPGGMPAQGVALSQNLQQRAAEANRQYQMRLQQQQQQQHIAQQRQLQQQQQQQQQQQR